jgi:hypothetical protein
MSFHLLNPVQDRSRTGLLKMPPSQRGSIGTQHVAAHARLHRGELRQLYAVQAVWVFSFTKLYSHNEKEKTLKVKFE